MARLSTGFSSLLGGAGDSRETRHPDTSTNSSASQAGEVPRQCRSLTSSRNRGALTPETKVAAPIRTTPWCNRAETTLVSRCC